MIIQTEKLVKNFGNVNALNGVDLKIETPSCMAMIGPNASAKTTLIKSILGLVIPTSGTISFKGQPVNKSWEYRRHIGYMPQIGRYPDNMMIGNLFRMIAELRKASLDTC